MTKPISVRLDEAVIQTLKDRAAAAAAGVSQADYLTGLIVASESPTPDESERVQALLAAAVVAQRVETELRDEIRELKRKLRVSREPDAPKEVSSDHSPLDTPKGAKCPHGSSWKTCRWAACRSIVEAQRVEREVPPHSFHSGTAPKPGCAECAALVKKAAASTA